MHPSKQKVIVSSCGTPVTDSSYEGPAKYFPPSGRVAAPDLSTAETPTECLAIACYDKLWKVENN